MIKSMTGFGSCARKVRPLGKVSVELKSSNHKYLDIVLHLPEGFLFLEEKIKQEIGSQIKRGRVTCVVSINGAEKPYSVNINKGLLKKYLSAMNSIKREFRIKDGISMDVLVQLPGIVSLQEDLAPKLRFWPGLNSLVGLALNELSRMRQKEGEALYGYLKKRAETLKGKVEAVQARFQKVIQEKLLAMQTEEERCSFLKDTDITEEIERLSFHVKNFTRTLVKSGAVGKELDFITQEMQRETNTIGAKCCDTIISGKVVELKSQIEKMREQLQNIE